MRKLLVTLLIWSTIVTVGYPQSPSHSIKTITVDCNHIDKEVELLTTFHVDFIPLETSKNSLIRRIEKVVAASDHFLVWDKSQKTIFVFGKDGRYLNKISAVSHPGPGEFTYCYDIDATGDKIYILSYQTILVYDMSLKYLKTIKIGKAYEKFLINDGWAYLYNNDQTPIDREKVGVADLSKAGTDTPILFEKREIGMFHLVEPFNFSCNSGEILFFYPLTDTVYSLQKTSVYPKYLLEFGDRKFAKNAFDKIPNDPMAPMNMANALRDTKFAYWTAGFVENKLGIFFRFSMDHNSLYYYRSASGPTHFLTSKFKLDSNDFNFNLIGFNQTALISCANPWELTPKLKEKIIKQGFKIEDDSNPLLVFLELQ